MDSYAMQSFFYNLFCCMYIQYCRIELLISFHFVETRVFLFHEKFSPYDFFFGVTLCFLSTSYRQPIDKLHSMMYS